MPTAPPAFASPAVSLHARRLAAILPGGVAAPPPVRANPSTITPRTSRRVPNPLCNVSALIFALAPLCAIAQRPDNSTASPCKFDPSQKVMEFAAEERIKLLPTGPLRAGEPNEIPLALKGPAINCISIDGNESGSVLRHLDGSAYVVITPTQLGKNEIAIMAFFADGGFAAAKAEVPVVPSGRPPAALILQVGGSPGSDTDLLTLGLDNNRQKQDPANREYLYPAAYYLDTKKPVEITADYLRFSVKQSQDKPVIAVSPDGGIKPLRIGEALLGISFGKTTREACIQVRSDVLAGDNSRCDRLRTPLPAAPLSTVWTQNPDGLRSEIGQSEFFVSRLSLTPPSHPVEVGQPISIPLTITAAKVRRFGYQQKRAGSNATIAFNALATRPPARTNAELEDGHFVHAPDGSTVFELVPVEIGEETVRVFARFEDDGFDERFFHVQTQPTERGLERINVDYFNYPPGHPHLVVGFRYRQLSNDVILHGLDPVKVTVTPPNMVRFDSDGTAHVLKEGPATVTVQFGAFEGKAFIQAEKGWGSASIFAHGLPAQGRLEGPGADSPREPGVPLIRVVSLTDTRGVDFGPYLQAVRTALEAKWKETFKLSAGNESWQKRAVTLQFRIMPDGYLMNGGLFLDIPSGNVSFDRAAWSTITASRYQRLPEAFHGPYFDVRAVFQGE